MEPYSRGMLDVGDGQSVYWECWGNPAGRPAVYLHGGPGSGAAPAARRYFDLDRFRVLLFDQRGCGRSRPSAGDPRTDLAANTTQHLVADIERLRELAYAEAHPDRVDGLVLALVTTTSAREVQWITEDVGRLFPRDWDRFVDAVPERLRGHRLVDAYAALLADPDPAVRERAAREWCRWEDTHVSLAPHHRPNPRFDDPDFRYLFARLVTHYWRHHAFLDDGRLIRDATALDAVPGVLIHGRYDVSGPLETAWRLHGRWSASELRIVDDAGHGGGGSFLSAVSTAVRAVADAGPVGRTRPRRR
jgi:proline iminopeptidase